MYLMEEEKFINSIDDLEDVVSEEVFKFLESNKEDDNQIIEDLKEEIDVYSDDNLCYRNSILDAVKEVEEIIEFINGSKRLNKNSLLNKLNNLYEVLDIL